MPSVNCGEFGGIVGVVMGLDFESTPADSTVLINSKIRRNRNPGGSGSTLKPKIASGTVKPGWTSAAVALAVPAEVVDVVQCRYYRAIRDGGHPRNGGWLPMRVLRASATCTQKLQLEQKSRRPPQSSR